MVVTGIVLLKIVGHVAMRSTVVRARAVLTAAPGQAYIFVAISLVALVSISIIDIFATSALLAGSGDKIMSIRNGWEVTDGIVLVGGHCEHGLSLSRMLVVYPVY
jgi:hypothetical protein